ncbi:hypothetical protein, partial [Vibrio vulnificus]|uniref:hypothetical protein n=1 Tax=Vibrio vulnificus TaxID=672 RepID=UPI0005F13EC9
DITVSDVSENQVVLSKLLLLTAQLENPLGKKCDFFEKSLFEGVFVIKAVKSVKTLKIGLKI